MPVEEMALAQWTKIAGTKSRAGVEQAIADIDGPGSEGEKNGNPSRKVHARGPGETQGPNYSDSWGIETRQMPKAQYGWRVKFSLHKIRAAREAFLRRGRVCQGNRHSSSILDSERWDWAAAIAIRDADCGERQFVDSDSLSAL